MNAIPLADNHVKPNGKLHSQWRICKALWRLHPNPFFC